MLISSVSGHPRPAATYYLEDSVTSVTVTVLQKHPHHV